MAESIASDLNCKVIALGAVRAGKTSILQYIRTHEFSSHTTHTQGVEQFSQRYSVRGVSIVASVWDTCSQERFLAISKMYYVGAVGAFLVFDLTDRSSLEKTGIFLEALRAQTADVKVVLIGNKLDLASEREVSREDAETYARNNDLDYFETSAKTGENIETVFLQILDYAVMKSGANGTTQSSANKTEKSITLQVIDEKKRKQKQCRC